jgi:hypothetical protein
LYAGGVSRGKAQVPKGGIMKKSIKRKGALLLILIIGSLTVFPGISSSLAAERWQDMPPLALSDCIDIDKVLAPNPLSSAVNDFWMVLKYEERDETSGETRIMNPDQSLNLYLVTGLALMASEGVGLPYYQFLIVTQTNGDSSSKTVQQWLLSDADNDGKLDKAKFERTVVGNEGQTINLDKVEIPDEQVQSFQDFYENATRELNSKAEKDTAKECLVS